MKWRPSPALVIACIALFVSLGGVSYAVATGSIDSRELRNNTIRSGDVRNNTLRTQDIRNNEVRGFDVRNSSIQGRDVAFNTLTGADIAESSLGKVPSATSADSAATVSSVQTVAPRALAEGSAPITLATHGPLTLTAACVETGGGDTAAQLRVQSTQTGAAAGTTDVPTITPGVRARRDRRAARGCRRHAGGGQRPGVRLGRHRRAERDLRPPGDVRRRRLVHRQRPRRARVDCPRRGSLAGR